MSPSTRSNHHRPGPHRDHYSYTVYADPETARSFDDRRFGGPIGELVAESQARVLADVAASVKDGTMLDVGTGTGRAALLFARAGAKVTGVDPSDQMLAVARERAAGEHVRIVFEVGDAHALAFADRSFDLVVSLRVLMHTPEWRTSLAEICRVARRLVVFDYPSQRSVALVQSAWRRIAHRFGARTEPYRVFSDREIVAALDAAGFRVRSVHRQFVLPIALHKTFGSRRFTVGVESMLDRAGLLRVFGSPVTIVAERCATS